MSTSNVSTEPRLVQTLNTQGPDRSSDNPIKPRSFEDTTWQYSLNTFRVMHYLFTLQQEDTLDVLEKVPLYSQQHHRVSSV